MANKHYTNVGKPVTTAVEKKNGNEVVLDELDKDKREQFK
jgi:hypothetical protein